MKRIKQTTGTKIVILIFILCCSFTGTHKLYAQKTKAVLTFKDGTTIKGLGKIVRDNVKFRKARKEKPVKHHFSTLERAVIYYSDDVINYVYIKVKDVEKPIVLEEVTTGNVSLYKVVTHGYNPGFGGGFGSMGGVGFGFGTSYSIKSYYTKRKEEDFAVHLGSTDLFSKNFKKAASEFFKDCPKLVQKIQDKEYKKRQLLEIVEYYNQHCN